MAVLRRVTFVLALLLALSAAIAIFVPRPEPRDDPTPRTGPATTTGENVTTPLRARLPRDKVVRAKVGDLVELTVTSAEPDSAALPELGLSEAAAPGAPARFSFLADRPGSYDVRLLLSEKLAGRVVVSRR